MTVSVNSPVERRQKKYEDIDIILKGLGIAQNFYNAKMDSDARAQALGLQKEANDIAREREASSTAYQMKKDEQDKSFRERELSLKEKESRAKIAESNLPKPKTVTASEAGNIGTMEAVNKALDKVYEDYKSNASQGGSGITGFFPGSKANIYKSSLKPAAQIIGTSLEGGKLSDADAERYAAMLPQPTDTNEQAMAKLNALKEMAQIKLEGQVGGLKKAGYDTAQFESGLPATKPAPFGIESQGMNEINASTGWIPGTIFSKNGVRYQVTADGKNATRLP